MKSGEIGGHVQTRHRTRLIKGFVSSDRAKNQKNGELIVSQQNCLPLKAAQWCSGVLCGVCMFSMCLRGFSLRYSSFLPQSKDMQISAYHQYSANTVYSAGGELLTSTEDIVGRWKKYFEDLLNPTDLPSNEEAEDGDSEVDSSITQAKVTEVVRKLLGGKALGVDEIRPEYLKSNLWMLWGCLG
ncbi:hypothetical protein L3Q82_005614 [Scortum barcoo]|uniref:Uncharacterized protein n=1 Tax=Scortum barcoo TaxID=214431 RepID=A0ACB8V6G8_9TELE|nr:hypothetical protein L3Q82_005614 [Scortum barcoo]